MHQVKKLSMVGLALAGLLLAIACSTESKQNQPVTTTTGKGTSTTAPSDQAEKRDHALVRLIHAIPKGPALDVFADDQKAFDHVTYKEVTAYKELPDKLRLNFAIRSAGNDKSQPLAENNEMISSGKHYTIVALPDSKGQASLKIVNDDLTPPHSDKAKLRVIHASPDAGKVEVYGRERKEAFFEAVNFQSEAGYKEVDPIMTTLEVRPEGKNNVLLAIPNTTLEAGRIYTIVIAGKTKGGPKLEAITIEDQLGSPSARLESPPSASKPRSN